jgi:hypothetical protein
MSQADDLLRQLNPAVPPVTAVSPGRRPAATPFEQQSFDELLQAFGAGPAAGPSDEPDVDGTALASDRSALRALDFSRIENASLRNLLTAAAAQDLPA